jgi:hypothetical protein
LVGPGQHGNTPGTEYTVWEWSGTAPANLQQYGMASTRGESPERVIYWDRNVHSILNSKEKWAEMMYTNQTYRYGFYQEATTNKIYVRLPNDLNPNNYYIYMGGAASSSGEGFHVNGQGVSDQAESGDAAESECGCLARGNRRDGTIPDLPFVSQMESEFLETVVLSDAKYRA